MRIPLTCCLLVLLAACGRAPDSATPDSATAIPASTLAHSGLPQGAYIWQRLWTPAHRAVLANSHELFSELRVLAAQQQPGDGWSEARVDLDALRIDARGMRLVIRLDGRLPTLDAGEISSRVLRLVQAWRAAGVRVDGIEIDFDGAATRMPEYARLLEALKTNLPHDATISIAVAPDWIDAPGLPTLLERADQAVLQLHATGDAAPGLFDEPMAAQRIAKFGALAKKPFDVALPAYGSATAAASADSDVTAGERREVSADPVAIAKLLRDLERAHPANLQAVLWFRLPLPGDRRAWPLATLTAVIRDQPLQAKLVADVHAGGEGAFDLEVANRGTLETALPAQLEVDATGCTAAEALPGYMAEQVDAGWRFVRDTDATLPASQTRSLGRIHCRQLAASNLRVHP